MLVLKKVLPYWVHHILSDQPLMTDPLHWPCLTGILVNIIVYLYMLLSWIYVRDPRVKLLPKKQNQLPDNSLDSTYFPTSTYNWTPCVPQPLSLLSGNMDVPHHSMTSLHNGSHHSGPCILHSGGWWCDILQRNTNRWLSIRRLLLNRIRVNMKTILKVHFKVITLSG